MTEVSRPPEYARTIFKDVRCLMFDFQPKIARIRYDKVPSPQSSPPGGEEGALAPGEGKRPPLQIRQVLVAIPQRSIAE
jgi:hypothetical protein